MSRKDERRSDEPERVVIRDNRKIDRDAPIEVQEPEPAVLDESAELLMERTRDLQRVQAEYANYRKRADRERLAAGDLAVSRVLADLLPVVDDIDRARAHGDLSGSLKAVAEHLESVFGKLGLVAFGEVGDPFDPEIHEAVLHDESADVTEPTCTTVMRAGYRHNDRLLRAAMVGVSDPISPAVEAEIIEVAEVVDGVDIPDVLDVPVVPSGEPDSDAESLSGQDETADRDAEPASGPAGDETPTDPAAEQN